MQGAPAAATGALCGAGILCASWWTRGARLLVHSACCVHARAQAVVPDAARPTTKAARPRFAPRLENLSVQAGWLRPQATVCCKAMGPFFCPWFLVLCSVFCRSGAL